ncbi:MAG: DUF948 domain-containing protein [Candidatus Firestonebacteria bacterium]|nr:DUF948 domain-containing protein [Candidatus Firestonebacteria bacterium]
MNTILLGIIAVCIIVITFYLIPVLIELKNSIISFRKTTEEKIDPILDELQGTLKNTKDITSNVNEIVVDVKELSHSINEVSKNINVINGLIKGANSKVTIKILSFKAGIMAALESLTNNLMKKEKKNV